MRRRSERLALAVLIVVGVLALGSWSYRQGSPAASQRDAGPLGLARLGLAPPLVSRLPAASASPRPAGVTSAVFAWYGGGQAAFTVAGETRVSADQEPVPIASLAKLMTAYLVSQRLGPDATVTVGPAEVAETARQAARGESVVTVIAGERLSRDQALKALLLPSANNIAELLAEQIPGFVARMNAQAGALGMHATTYTDPSGYDPATRSTAADQLTLLRAVLRVPVLARVLGESRAALPVAGVVTNTDTLLGREGFVAGKTGSTTAAGGCLAFRVRRRGAVLDGVVLGQQGGPLIAAGLRGAQQLATLELGP